MLSLSCCHDQNVSISSSTCLANNVEESQQLLEQDLDLKGASSVSSSSSSTTHICLMAKEYKVSPTVHSNISHDDDDYLIKEKFDIVSHALLNNKNAHENFLEIMTTLFELKETFEAMETRCHEGWGLARDSAGEVHNLENALEEEQETRVALEERLESSEELNNEVIAKLTKKHDHAIAKCNVLSKQNAK